MLTLFSSGGSRDCQGLSRRDFLQVGALGLGSLALPGLLASRKAAAAQGGYVRDKSVVLVFLGGGASHIETFNPNMDAPSPYCSVTGEVATSIPGVTFGGTFPQLSNLAHRMAVVRSFHHPVGDHESAIVHVMSGGTNPTGKRDDLRGYSMSSACAKLRGTVHPSSGLPMNVLLTAPETDSQFRTEKGRVTRGAGPGSLGAAYAPFDPDVGSTALENMRLHVPPERLQDRRWLLQELDAHKRHADSHEGLAAHDAFNRQALDLVLRGVDQAFDLSREPARLVERYDTGMFTIGHKKGRPHLVRPSTLGTQLLLARRLVEAGCGFVTVQSAGWDNHADGNNPNMRDGMEMLGPPLDKALSAFLEDLELRGLVDQVLVVLTGDFGRTPRLNKNGGRDHWANLCTLALAGGGLKMGQVIGKSARNNDVPTGDPISTPNLMSTLMHTLFDVGQLRVQRGVPPDMLRFIEAAPPIAPLL